MNHGGIGSSGKRSLIVGFLNGRQPKTYVPKDYDQLQWAITQANNESKRSESKIFMLEKANHAAIELQMDAMHQRVWLKEWERLGSFRSRFQRDVDEVLQLISLIPRSDDRSLFELVEQQEDLEETVRHFQSATLQPIDEFSSDIQYWVKNRWRDQSLSQDPLLIKETFKSIKNQQLELLQAMDDEQKQLEKALKIRNLQAEFEDGEEMLEDVDELDAISTARTDATAQMMASIPNRLEVPTDIVDAQDCDLETKNALLAEFQALDDGFHEQMSALYERLRRHRLQVRAFEEQMGSQTNRLLEVVVDQNHQEIVDPWKLIVFEGVYRRAPTDLPKSWYALYIHFLHLLYPKHKRWQLSQGASLVHQYVALKKRCRVLMNDWRRAHAELADRCRELLARNAEQLQEAHARSIDFAEQKRLCARLTEQVNNWRRLKMEEAKLMQELEMSKMAEEAEQLAAQAAKEKEEIRQKKEKIEKFKEEKAQKRSDELRKAEERLAEVKKQLAEQSEIDWQRINFRKEIFDDRRRQAQEKLKELELDDARREERLEALRRQVRVEAPSN